MVLLTINPLLLITNFDITLFENTYIKKLTRNNLANAKQHLYCIEYTLCDNLSYQLT